MDTLQVNGHPYTVTRLLGKGKGGYSYLAQGSEGPVVVKQIHHEPCSYYQFGDKLQSELRDSAHCQPWASRCRACWRWTKHRNGW